MHKTFAHHTPSEARLIQIRMLEEAYSSLLHAIEEHCATSREKSLAVTNLETSAMWAIKALVFNDLESKVEAP